jgi:hypothetical protein
MRGYVYRSGRRRTGSTLLTVATGIAVGLALILASVSSAYAKAPAHAARTRPPVVVIVGVTHVKLSPVAHAAGHKIA